VATFAGIGAVSAAILMTELALTRIFSVTMYYHFAFLVISIALFGLSASAVLVYVLRRRLASIPTAHLLTRAALLHAVGTVVALALLVRVHVGLNYSSSNLVLMLVIYVLAALPFLTGGAVIAIAFTRLAARINVVYAADLLGAAAGCLALLPLLNQLGAPGVVLTAAGLALCAAVCFAPPERRMRMAVAVAALFSLPAAAQVAGAAPFEVTDTKGHEGDRVLFSKWNSFSRVAVYERDHGDWSLSPTYSGPRGEALFMDIDSAASTPILKSARTPDQAEYLRHELTALAYHLVERPGDFTALVIGPGGGRDLVSALGFGARHVDGVEINPIIARDVMLDRFFDYSGGIYAHPRVTIHVDDGRSFVRRSTTRYDVIQASLVDTWAATAAGAYTLTENSLYTTEAFAEYLDHLTDAGILTISRWVFDGLRLVSLGQAASEARGLDAARHLAVVQLGRVATFLLKKQPFTPAETNRLEEVADRLGFTVLYAPGGRFDATSDYARLIMAPNPPAFIERHPLDISPTTDDRPFFFHTTRLGDQFGVAFGRSMLFGNGLSALLTLIGISGLLVALFVIGPLLAERERHARGWGKWLLYFGALGAGFMLLEVALLQRFVLLLGHPVYSLTVTLFSLLLGTGLGSLISRRVREDAIGRAARRALVAVVLLAVASAAGLAAIVDLGIAWPLPARIAAAGALLLPIGVLLGIPLPAGMRLLAAARPALIPWGLGMNGALSVVGATLAVFLAMNWGFSSTLSIAGLVYGIALVTISRT
jgi:hypothetical protein